jgi:hypothetical protein
MSWKERREKARRSAFLNSAPPKLWKQTVAAQFAEYWLCIHPDPMLRPNDESAQFIDTRRPFYAGIFSILSAIRAIAEPGVSEDEGTDHIEACWQECVAFNERLKRLYGIEWTHEDQK